MTYKHIIENMVLMNGSAQVEDILQEITGKGCTFLQDESVDFTKDLDYGISFRFTGRAYSGYTAMHINLIAAGYVNEYGSVSVCSLWAPKGAYKTLLWTCVAGVEDSELVNQIMGR